MTKFDISNTIFDFEMQIRKVNLLLRTIEENYFNFREANWCSDDEEKRTNALGLCLNYEVYSGLLDVVHDITFELENSLAKFQEDIDTEKPAKVGDVA